jgi:hypothetical protein
VEGLGAMGPEARPAVKALVKRYEDIKTREAAGKAREGDYYRLAEDHGKAGTLSS